MKAHSVKRLITRKHERCSIFGARMAAVLLFTERGAHRWRHRSSQSHQHIWKTQPQMSYTCQNY